MKMIFTTLLVMMTFMSSAWATQSNASLSFTFSVENAESMGAFELAENLNQVLTGNLDDVYDSPFYNCQISITETRAQQKNLFVWALIDCEDEVGLDNLVDFIKNEYSERVGIALHPSLIRPLPGSTVRSN